MTSELQKINKQLKELSEILGNFAEITKDKNKNDYADDQKNTEKKKRNTKNGKTGAPSEGVQHDGLEEREGSIPDDTPAV